MAASARTCPPTTTRMTSIAGCQLTSAVLDDVGAEGPNDHAESGLGAGARAFPAWCRSFSTATPAAAAHGGNRDDGDLVDLVVSPKTRLTVMVSLTAPSLSSTDESWLSVMVILQSRPAWLVAPLILTAARASANRDGR